MRTLIVIFLFLLAATFSHAQVYKWVDEQGVVHFTDDLSQIPEKHRKAMERREEPEEKTEVKREGQPPQRKSWIVTRTVWEEVKNTGRQGWKNQGKG